MSASTALPSGRFMYTILAGVNAMRSRDDGEKVKMGLQRKHEAGGTWGPARLGYLNAREQVGGRDVAVVIPDPDRADLIHLAFDLFATGDFTITTLAAALEEAGLRTRGTPKRPSKPLSRSQVHRILRDDFYIQVVTLNGVKRPGRHEALVSEATFERVQQLLDAHRASGDRTQKHQHYLAGSLYCSCGKRMGYGRHTGKSGAHYAYFSCLSRVSKQGPCPASYAPVDAIEVDVAAEYLTNRLRLTRPERDLVRRRVRDHAEARAQTATRESERHARRLRELTDQQQKLLQLFYRDLVSEEALRAEQERIKTERTQAHRWAEAATRDVTDVMQARDEALGLLDHPHAPYRDATPSQRRLLNQALFSHIFVIDPGTVDCELNEFYEQLIALAQSLAQGHEEAAEGPPAGLAGPNDPGRAQNGPDPIFRGQGSHFDKLAGRAGQRANPPAHLETFVQVLMDPTRRQVRARATRGLRP